MTAAYIAAAAVGAVVLGLGIWAYALTRRRTFITNIAAGAVFTALFIFMAGRGACALCFKYPVLTAAVMAAAGALLIFMAAESAVAAVRAKKSQNT